MPSLAVCCVMSLLAVCVFGQTSQPYERYFFDTVDLLVIQYVPNTTDWTDAISEMFDAFPSTAELLELREMVQFVDPSTNSGPVRTDQIGIWQRWDSLEDYLARPNVYNPNLPVDETDYFLRLSDLGNCHYCGTQPYQPVLAHFLNSQSNGKYPIIPTFTLFLADETAQEVDTLNYFVSHPIMGVPTDQLIDINFDRADFWEMYTTPAAFDYHVEHVNNTLRPLATNWFVDLGNVGTYWHRVLRYTDGCFQCNTAGRLVAAHFALVAALFAALLSQVHV